MASNRKIRKLLMSIQKIYKKDPAYSNKASMQSTKLMLWGEKIVKHDKQYIISSFLPPLPSKAYFQLATASQEKENIYTQQSLSKRSAPISFFLGLTYKCNFDCKHCSAKLRKKDKELTTEEWKSVIKRIQDMGTSIIGFTGGEPLLREDLTEIINSIDNRSVTILYTNGKGLTYEIAKEYKENGLWSAAISLDSHDKCRFNEFRSSDQAFDISVEAIQNCQEAGLYTMMQSVFTKSDVTEENFMELFKLGRKLKVHEIRLLEPIKSGKLLKDSGMEEIFFDKETRQKVVNFQLKINRKLGYPKMTSFAHTESDEKYGCGAATQHSYITPNGELLPCDFVPLSFGNVIKEDVSKLWLEMNEAFGIPKSGCFANTINHELKKFDDDQFPLKKEISMELVSRYKTKVYPRIYQLRQSTFKMKK